MVAGMTSVFVLTARHHISISKISDVSFVEYIHSDPWTRIAGYQVGVLFGMFYHEWKNRKNCDELSNTFGTNLFQRVKYSKILRYSFIVIGLILQIFLIIMPQVETRYRSGDTNYLPQMFNNFFNTFSRPTFVISLSMIIISPLSGHNQFIKTVLGSKGFVPWARLTYVAYIIHVTM